MWINKIVFLLGLIQLALAHQQDDEQEGRIRAWFEKLNFDIQIMNRKTAEVAWELNTRPSELTLIEGMNFSAIKSDWGRTFCEESNQFVWQKLSPVQQRSIFLMCRGPKWTNIEAKALSHISDSIQAIYTETLVCIPKSFDLCRKTLEIWSVTFIKTEHQEIRQLFGNDKFISGPLDIDVEELRCFSGEPDLEEVMTGNFSILTDCELPTEPILKWAYDAWRVAIGYRIGKKYPRMVHLMNLGARRNGFSDIGAVWRQELEMPNLRETMDKLWSEIKPFYKMLHAVIRYILYQENKNIFPDFKPDGTIPAHLLRNMWSNNWSAFLKYFIKDEKLNIDSNIKRNKWTVLDMVKRADDFYSSLGLYGMTNKFWNYSIIEKAENFSKCHGTAANMYDGDDYRMIVCAKKGLEDFYVIHHEMGHIQYYMQFRVQPGIFQDGTNSAISESIGDAIYNSVLTPQHLSRLGLLEDRFLPPKQKDTDIRFLNYKLVIPRIKRKGVSALQSDDPDLILLLTMALSKIPQIPFDYLLDVYRWDLFSGKEPKARSSENEYFWELLMNEQGIHPPDVIKDRTNLFDAAAKFHVADNTPYVRYFLASIMQVQITKGLCQITVFDKPAPNEQSAMALHRCDIYGSKRAGNALKESLSLGASVAWPDVLFLLTGSRDISTQPLLEYYRPLIDWLEEKIDELDIPVGW